MRRRINIFRDIDWFTVILYLALMLLGWINIYSAGYKVEFPNIFDTTQEYGKQFIWIISACALAFAVLLFEGDVFRRLSPLFYGIVVLLLILVLLFGKEVNGARAWFGFGSFGIQPSEFAKLGTCLALSAMLSSRDYKIKDLKTKLFAALIIGVPSALILLQPDTGTVLIFLGLVFVLYREGLSGNILLLGFLAITLSVVSLLMRANTFEIPWTSIPLEGHYLLMIIIVLVAIALYFVIKSFVLPRYRRGMFGLLIIGLVSSLVFIGSVDYVMDNVLDDHQRTRINILLGLEEDPQGAGYNVKQSKTAIGSGGLSGKGFLEGTLTKYKYVPMQTTDFIFCTVGEEWGFLGSGLVVILFVALMLRLIFIAERQRLMFTRIYGYCVTSIFFMHFLINIGMAIGLAPVIGIPLPFFSYGGSSLWSFTLLIFILLKLDSERKGILR